MSFKKPVPHTTMWVRIMNNPKTDTIPWYDDASQKEFEHRCLAFISTDIRDVVSTLFYGGCIISKIHFPIAREVVEYADWYVNSPDIYNKLYENEPTIANWQFVFGKNYPFHVNKPTLIEYYKTIKKMMASDVEMPLGITTDIEQINLEKMEREVQEELERSIKSSNEFMRKILETNGK